MRPRRVTPPRLFGPVAAAAQRRRDLENDFSCRHKYAMAEATRAREIGCGRMPLNFMVAARRPLARVPYHPGPHHVQVDIHHAARQMLATLHRRGVMPVLPKCPEPLFASLVRLSRAPFE